MAQTGECARKCKELVGEIAVMEAGGGRVLKQTRAMEVVTSSDVSLKRRKLVSDVHRQLVISHHRHDVNSPANSSSPATSGASDRTSASLCSTADSTELIAKSELRSVDLKVESLTEGYETENSKLIKCRFSRETTPSSELDSSMATKQSTASLPRKHPDVKMPPAAEIEEFFSAAEKHEQKRFADKYNYDVKKDVPLVGQYQWVRLKP